MKIILVTLVFTLFLCCNVGVLHAKNILVGGSSTWTQGVDYTSWAAKQSFNNGDILVFNYGSLHNVNEVDKDGYDNCDGSNPIISFSGGSANIPLTKLGTRYFICTTSSHCSSGGMKLEITVTGQPNLSGDKSPSVPVKPSGGGSGAAPTFVTENTLLIASALVLTTIFGFMEGSAGLY